MSEDTRCFVCRGESEYTCRLSDADDPEEWVEVLICGRCWQAAEWRHRQRLMAQERRRLAAWYEAQAAAESGH